MADLFLPLGQHRLDFSPEFDPIRSLLRSIWTDTVWLCERVASIEAAGDDQEEVRRELAYLRGDTDDALQHLARLIELLLQGHVVDLQKRLGGGNSPPYFQGGESMAPQAIPALGQNELDPPSEIDPVRFFLSATKGVLVQLEEYRVAFQRLWESGLGGAAAELGEMVILMNRVYRHVPRLIEILLAGHQIDWAKSGPSGDALRLFKPCTSTEWFACGEVDLLCKMLRHLDYGVITRFSDRKWRLFGVACVRRVMHAFREQRTRELVGMVERLADGLLTEEELQHLWGQARNPPNPDAEYPEDCSPEETIARCAFQSLAAIPFGPADAARAIQAASWARSAAGERKLEEEAQVALLRDLFGNPYRPAPPSAPALLAWNDGTVVRLAQAIYDERTFDRLPVLADALEDAGCTDGEVLAHCRQPGTHVRGCWVVDLILSKDR